ncbi:MAG: tetratricopeptide repeat protein [Leptospirillia bacterium]
MSSDRIAQYQAFLEKDPNNAFARYVIAQEYLKLDRLDEAVAAFRGVIEVDADYVAAYYHGGKALERAGDSDAARTLYTEGIEAANRKGDGHGRAELEEALTAV